MSTFTERDDAREAYRAGLSGAREYKASSEAADKAFFRGAASNIAMSQADRPDDFRDNVIGMKTGSDDDYSSTIKVVKSAPQEQLEKLQNQDDAFKFLNRFDQNKLYNQDGLLNRDVLDYLKAPLSGIGAFTTDMNEGRNVYQLLINKMFQGDRDQMRGAQPLAQGDVEGMRRLGRTLFRDPNVDVTLGENLRSLFPGVTNPGVVDIRNTPGGGITALPQFGQAGLDFTKEQGFRDYGALLENLAKFAVPLPLKAAFGQAGEMGDDLFLQPIKNLFNLGEEEVIEEPEEKNKKDFFFF